MNRPLNVALVNAADHGGGAEASTLSLHRALIRLGHYSQLFVGTKLTNEQQVYQIKRFRSIPGVMRGARFLERCLGWQYLYHPWFRKLDRQFSGRIDVLHVQTLWAGREGYADVGGLPQLSRRYPMVMTLRDLWMLTGHCGYPALHCDRWKTGCGACPDLNIPPAIPRDGTRFNWRRKRRMVQSSNLRVTTVSNWLGDRVRESPIFAGKTIETVYNGVDGEHFHPRPRAETRDRHGLPQDAFIVMLAGQTLEGTFVGKTGAVDYALDALAASGVDPYVLGVGHSSGRVLERWGRRGIAVPFQNDPAVLGELYAASDVVLLTSLWETFGRVAAEGQMCGIPVVGFATGGIPEIVEHGKTGLIVPQLDAPALAAALKSLAAQPDLRIRMGQVAARRAVDLFSNDSIAAQFVEQYRAAIAEHRTPRPAITTT